MAIPLLLCFLLPASGFLFDHTDVHLYISPTGSDSNDGLQVSRPVKTLHHAVSLLSSGQLRGKNVVFELLAGHHTLHSTLTVTHRDGHLVTFRSHNGAAAYITGGKRIDSHFFKPVTDPHILNRLPATSRSHVKVAHLSDTGVTDYGHISPYGFYTDRTAQLEVFLNDRPLRLARWPNEGFVNIVSIPDGTTGRRFTYNGHVSRSWQQEAEPWAYGYWYWSWADRAMKIDHIDTTTSAVTLVNHPRFGLRTGHWPKGSFNEQGGYCRFFNILAELDQPGEYYIDKKAGNLYVWFPTGDGHLVQSDDVYVSMVNNCITLGTNSQNVVFQDLTLEACRAVGISGSNVRNVSIVNMEIRNTGGYNVKFRGDSRAVTVSRSFFHDGDGAVSIAGGSRNSLAPSGSVVADNEMWRFSREGAVGKNAVELFGVGTTTQYNLMHVGQYGAIRFWGNNHHMEYNHIHHTCMNASDCGAIFTGRDWTTLGNVIRFNSIHHTLRLVPGADIRGIMLDDQSSGTLIENNVFYENEVHVNIGGGRHNIVQNNIMYNATKYAMQVDARGVSHKYDADLEKHLHDVSYTSAVWQSRYPELVNFDSQNKSLPEGNVIATNVFYKAGGTETLLDITHGYIGLFNITNNMWAVSPSEFYNPTAGDFRSQCALSKWEQEAGFQQPLTPSLIGPRHPVGPSYNLRDVRSSTPSKVSAPCTTQAPATNAPTPPYLPDGSRPNTLYNVSKQGCWFIVSGCSHDPAAVGTYRDTYGEQHSHGADSEEACFSRAVAQWHYCGSHPGQQVTAIYGPTGATTIVGDGCFMAMYGCPNHSGSAGGHAVAGHINRDVWAEQHQNADQNEAACLARAHAQWTWCGSSPNNPVTSLFRPTGKSVTVGAGCWIHVLKCPADPQPASMFYDSWGAANIGTDVDELACLSRAAYYWGHCGSHREYPVTAHYRPKGASFTAP